MEPTGTRTRRAAPGAWVAALASGLLLGGALAGCGRESQDARGARLAAERYLDALGRNDLASLRQRSTCVFPSQSIVGGVVLRVETPRSVPMAKLDSLARAAAADHRALDSLWALGSEEALDSLFLRSQVMAHRHGLYRNAIRAASLSLDGEEVPENVVVRTCRIRVRIRYQGSLVGPKAIDREHVLRLLAAPGGRWIVFSAHLREEDPRPVPI